MPRKCVQLEQEHEQLSKHQGVVEQIQDETQVLAAKEEIERLKGEVEAVRSELEATRNAFEKELAEAKLKAQQLEESLVEEKAQRESQETAMAELSQQVANHTATEGSHQQTVVELQSTVVELQGTVTSLQEKVTMQDAELAKVEEFKTGLRLLEAEYNDLKTSSQEAAQAHEAKAEVLQAKLGEATMLMEEERAKYVKESTVRRQLHNEVMELKGNIRVYGRIRPPNAGHAETAVESRGDDEIFTSDGSKVNNFQYDRVFGSQSSQQDVFNEVEPLVTSVVDGYNGCIFAYGQTGSGKTYTMMGGKDDPGVIIRTLGHLFAITQERTEQTYDFTVNMLEIYNETARDLLVESSSDKSSALDVKQDAAGRMYCPGSVTEQVATMQDVLNLLDRGSRNRAVASTNCNEHSSRSHCVLSININGENIKSGTKTHSRLHLIDLAGSERLSRSGAIGAQQKEAQNINKSLSALGDVMNALFSSQKHIPFRNSKLTYLLQDSLSGGSKVLMIMQASPSAADLGETLCTLRFAERVRATSVGAAKKNTESGDFARCRQQLAAAQKELNAKTEELEKAVKQTREHEKLLNKKDSHAQEEQKQTLAASRQDCDKLRKEKEALEGVLLAERKEKEQLEQQQQAEEIERVELQAELDEMKKILQTVQQQHKQELEAAVSKARKSRRSSMGVIGALEEISNDSPTHSILSPGDSAAAELFGDKSTSSMRRRLSTASRRSSQGWTAWGEGSQNNTNMDRSATTVPVGPMQTPEHSKTTSRVTPKEKLSKSKLAASSTRSAGSTRNSVAGRTPRKSTTTSSSLLSSGRAVRVPATKLESTASGLRRGAKRVDMVPALRTGFKF